jgi:hypothetical protein
MRILHLSLLCVFLGLPFSGVAQTSTTTPKPSKPNITKPAADAVALDAVIMQVKTALAATEGIVEQKTPMRMKTVTLTFQTVSTKEVGPTINLWIIKFGHKVEKDVTQQMTIVLGPPSPPRTGLASSIDEELEAQILTAVTGVANASQPPVPLQPQKLTIDMSFVVKEDTTAGATAKFTLIPVTLDMSGELKKETTQKLSLEFDAPNAAKPDTPKPE